MYKLILDHNGKRVLTTKFEMLEDGVVTRWDGSNF